MSRLTATDPLALRSDTLFWLFGWYLRWFFWRRFRAVRVSRAGLPELPPGRPVIVCSNHPSWWDPALFIMLQTKLFPGRRGYGPMNAEALGRYGVLERMGIFGIEMDSPRGAARFLATSLRVLSDPANVLWITAEGHFTDSRRRPVVLRPGIAHLARRVPDAVPYCRWRWNTRSGTRAGRRRWLASDRRSAAGGTVPPPIGRRTLPPP